MQCPCCHEEISAATFNNDAAKTSARCGHQFHHKCIAQWMEIANSCPMCRADINELFVEYNDGAVIIPVANQQQRVHNDDISMDNEEDDNNDDGGEDPDYYTNDEMPPPREWVVDKILARRYDYDDGYSEYFLVRWANRTHSETWEPRELLEDTIALETFLRRE